MKERLANREISRDHLLRDCAVTIHSRDEKFALLAAADLPDR